MPKYRKKPIEIEAVRAKDVIAAYQHDWQIAPDWLRAARDRGGVNIEADGVIIATPEGVSRAGVDDWIVEGIEGEIYPVKASIFASSYEEVLDDPVLDDTAVGATPVRRGPVEHAAEKVRKHEPEPK